MVLAKLLTAIYIIFAPEVAAQTYSSIFNQAISTAAALQQPKFVPVVMSCLNAARTAFVSCGGGGGGGGTYTADELSIDLSGSNVFSALSSSVTLQGNSFNGSGQLVQVNGSGQLPAVSGALLTNLPGSTDFGPSTAALSASTVSIAATMIAGFNSTAISTAAIAVSTTGLLNNLYAVGASTLATNALDALIGVSTAATYSALSSTGSALTVETERAITAENVLSASTASIASTYLPLSGGIRSGIDYVTKLGSATVVNGINTRFESVAQVEAAPIEAPGMLQSYTRFSYTMIDPFDSVLSSFTKGSQGLLTIDNSDVVVSTNSMQLSTNGGGTQTIMKKFLASPINLTGVNFLNWMKITGIINLAQGPFFYLSSDNLVANFYTCDLGHGASGNTYKYFQDGEWTPYTWTMANCTVTGNPNLAAINAIQVAVYDNGVPSSTVTVHVNGFATFPQPTQGYVVVEEDNFDTSYSTNAAAIAALYNVPIQVNWTPEDAGGGPNFPTVIVATQTSHNYMSPFGLHAGGTFLDTVSTNAVQNLWAHDQSYWRNGFGMQRRSGYCIYPHGAYNPQIEAIAESQCSAARTIVDSDASGFEFETFPVADPFRLRCYSVLQSDNVGKLTTMVTTAANNKAIACFLFHRVEETSGGGISDVSSSTFRSFMQSLSTSPVVLTSYPELLTRPYQVQNFNQITVSSEVIQSTSSVATTALLDIKNVNGTPIFHFREDGAAYFSGSALKLGSNGAAAQTLDVAGSIVYSGVIMGPAVENATANNSRTQYTANGSVIDRNVNDTLNTALAVNQINGLAYNIQKWEYGGAGIATMTAFGLNIGTIPASVLTSSNPFSVNTTSMSVIVSTQGAFDVSGGTVPILTGCGAGPTIAAGSNCERGSLIMGASASSAGCVLSFPSVCMAKPPICVITGGNEGSLLAFGQTAAFTGACDTVTTGAAAACGTGTFMAWICLGN